MVLLFGIYRESRWRVRRVKEGLPCRYVFDYNLHSFKTFQGQPLHRKVMHSFLAMTSQAKKREI